MKLVNTVRKKIWFCVNLALLGFLVATAFALYSNHRLQIHLEHIRDIDFQLAMRSTELLNQFEAQTDFYEESFLFGLPESAQKGNALSEKIVDMIETLTRLSNDSDERHNVRLYDLLALKQSYRDFAQRAADIYPLLARGADAVNHVPQLQELATAQHNLHNQITYFAGFYRDAFNDHVTSLMTLAQHNNELLAGFLLTLLAVITLVVNMAANRLLITPLAHIKEAIRAFGRGQRSFPRLETMDRGDDIGELGLAFLTMAEELEITTVSKDYVDSILRNMNDSLLVTTDDFIIRRVNRATLELLGYHEDDLIGRHIGQVLKDIPARPELTDSVDIAMLPHLYNNTEKTLIARGGRQIPALLSVSRLTGDGGVPRGLVYVARDITERKQAEQKLEHLAQCDFLTGLPNRLVFNARLQRTVLQAKRTGRQVGLLFIDLDRFKIVNDTLGHAAGDTLLKTLAKRLHGCVREDDTLARLGGDEFAVILENITTYRQAAHTARRLLAACVEPTVHEENAISTSISIGIAIFPFDSQGTDELLKNADLAMYRAKQGGGNRFCFFSDEPLSLADEASRADGR